MTRNAPFPEQLRIPEGIERGDVALSRKWLPRWVYLEIIAHATRAKRRYEYAPGHTRFSLLL
jgi:hypothetical protein